ncbi:MAG TPA: DUF1802 family protein, partial [Baekduia sp.]|nr:DUF1802 family protein [Baekduia sp.]
MVIRWPAVLRRRGNVLYSSGWIHMPIALKEWAVTVRALAEGEQLLTLRPALDGEEAPFEHDQFFLFPNFDEQRNDL